MVKVARSVPRPVSGLCLASDSENPADLLGTLAQHRETQVELLFRVRRRDRRAQACLPERDDRVRDGLDVNAATFATIKGEDYTVVRVYGAWQATPRVALKARIENLLDEKYEQVHGYPQLGLGAFAGIEMKF